MPDASSEPASANDTAIDLYCLHCGYNLRGLSGDPRRCPECFTMNPVGLITAPAEAIAHQLKRMETIPALCVGLALIAAAPLVFLLIGSVVWHRELKRGSGLLNPPAGGVPIGSRVDRSLSRANAGAALRITARRPKGACPPLFPKGA